LPSAARYVSNFITPIFVSIKPSLPS
jgi:hypothetical protein